MRKLLLAFAGLSVIGATAQEARMDLGRSAAMYTASHADGTPLNTSSNKSAAAVYTGTAPNVYGAGFPRNFIASFSWGGPQGTMEYKIDKALDTANRMMQRRGLAVDEVEQEILQSVYEQTAEFRR